MRYCPFCSAENVDEATHCGTCARRLPPLSPRRKRESPVDARSTTQLPRSSNGDLSRAQTLSPPRPTRRALAPTITGDTDRVTPVPLAIPRPEPTPIPIAPARPASVPAWTSAEPARPQKAPAEAAIVELSSRPDPTAKDNVPVTGEKETPKTRPSPEPTAPGQGPPGAFGDDPEPPTNARAESEMDAPATDPDQAPVETRPDLSLVPSPASEESQLSGPYAPAEIVPVPPVPEPGLIASARYAVSFARARWQRRAAIKELEAAIRDDTAALDAMLGDLGKKVRDSGLTSPALKAENQAVADAEGRKIAAEKRHEELCSRQSDEAAKFADIEAEKQARVTEVEQSLDVAEGALDDLEAKRRGFREKKKTIERQQKTYLKTADDRDEQAGDAESDEKRDSLRRSAKTLRGEAAALDGDRAEAEENAAKLERPISQAIAKVEALKGELDSVKRALNDAREGHRHRMAELEAEISRRSREISQAEAEIQRALVTLGTLANLHRPDHPQFTGLYGEIDEVRGAIGARSREVDRLIAERDAYDRGSLIRGTAVLGGGVLGVIALVVIILAIV
ncbi:MAG TPA: hypothetical protein VFG83_05555 [Kofleriaceae bacterium]|nr:hypothetical protein [Kofleriaceae bacterium]